MKKGAVLIELYLALQSKFLLFYDSPTGGQVFMIEYVKSLH